MFEAPALDARFEGWRFPELEGFRWLHVVMTVNQEVRPLAARSAWRLCQHDWISGSGAHPGFEPNTLAVALQPLRASLQIRLMLRLRRHAWESHIVAKLLDEPFLVGV